MTTYKKIKALLELGTLKGVNIDMKDGEKFMGIETVIGIYDDDLLICCDGSTLNKTNLNMVTNITPIPQKPKFLGCGDKVKILEGKHKGEIVTIRRLTTLKLMPTYEFEERWDKEIHDVPYYAVVPVFEEEEEQEKIKPLIDREKGFDLWAIFEGLHERITKLEEK